MIYNLFDFSDRVAGEFKKSFISFPYLEELCYWVERCVTGRLPEGKKNLIVAIPPRHYKTTFISQNMPAWALGEIAPDCEFILTSATSTLATANAMAVKKILTAPWYKELYPHVQISSDDKDVQNYFKTTSGGCVYASGLGGTITGFGAGKTRDGFGGAIIIDDPLKADEASSVVMRENNISYYTDTLKSRRNSVHTTPMILVAQRLHLEDLIGWVIDNEAADWHIVSFQALKDGKVLNPLTTSVEQLTLLKETAPGAFYAQYQQQPIVDGGAIFNSEWIQYYTPTTLPKKFNRIIQSWDMAFKDADDSDFVVGQVWGQEGADCYLLDQVRGRWGFTQTVEAVKALSAKWPRALEKLVEDKANGPAVIDSLKHKIMGLIPVEPDGSKTARAYAITPLWQARNVWLPSPQSCDWIRDFTSELAQFPSSSHDDQVDAMTQALRRLSGRPRLVINPSIIQGRRTIPALGRQ